MALPIYRLYVDWNGNGVFTDAGEDASDDLYTAQVDRGFADFLARVAKTGTASFVLSNADRQYSPPLVANALPRRAVRFDMTTDTGTATLFRGFVREIRPTAGQHGPRRVTLECEDGLALLDTHEGAIALQTDVAADDIVSAVVGAVYTPPSTDYDAGINAFPLSADRWSEVAAYGVGYQEAVASQKVLDACASDWGRFFIGKAGAAVFANRHRTALDTTTELTLADDMTGMEYAKSVAPVFNYVEIRIRPRSVSSTLEVLATVPGDRKSFLRVGESTSFRLNFVDPNDTARTVGGKDVLAPVAGTDVVANTLEGGGGTDQSAGLALTLTARAEYAEVGVTNNAGIDVYLTTVRVRGYPVRTAEEVTLVEQAGTSQTAYQKRKLSLTPTLMNTPAEARSLASYLLDVLRDPRNEVTGVTFVAVADATLTDAARDLELLARVALSETQTGLAGFVGFVRGLRHDIRSNAEHVVTLDLEAAFDPGTPFRLDTSRLDSGHALIY